MTISIPRTRPIEENWSSQFWIYGSPNKVAHIAFVASKITA